MPDNTSAVRTPDGGYAVPPESRTPFHVRDRRTEVAGYVHRAILRNALGESYAYDVVPVCAPTGNGGLEVGYVLYVSTALPVPVGSRCCLASKPFEFDADEAFVGRVTEAVLTGLRKAVGEALRMP
jgi:hypothetical protein